jgi:hypothetical protein
MTPRLTRIVALSMPFGAPIPKATIRMHQSALRLKVGGTERLGAVGPGRQAVGRFDSSNELTRVNTQAATSRSSGGGSIGIALVTV